MRDALGSSPPASWWALLLGLGFPPLFTLLYFVALSGQAQGLVRGVYVAGKSFQFALPLLVFFVAHRRLPRPTWPSISGAGTGLLFGLAIYAVACLLYFGYLRPQGAFAAPAAALHVKASAFGLQSPAAFVGLGVFYSLVHAAAEEYYWRWFVFGGLRGVTVPWAAILGSAVGFTAHHVVVLAVYFGWGSPWTWLLSLSVGVGGAVWAWLYARSGSLLGPWLSHVLADAAIFTVGFDLLRQPSLG